MKIVFMNEGIYEYASGAPEATGGAERQHWLLARALGAAGWTVTVAVRGGLLAGKRRTIGGVELVGIGTGQVLLAWHRFLSSERPEWLIWKAATHLWGPLVEIARRVGVRTIFYTAFDRDVKTRSALAQRPRWWPLYAWGLARADRILVQHGGQLTELAAQWRAKAYIVPSIASGVAYVKPHAERAQYVAWVGMLRQPKRPDLLIEIARKAPAIRFIVCGGTTTHRSTPGYSQWVVEALRALPNVEFLGQVAPEKALQVIADAALILSTSDEEGFPSTFLEAWASGTPVVSLKIDPNHIIERAGLGTVPGTIEKAITDIEALLDSPQLRDELAVRARQYVVENHSEAAVIRVFEQTIRVV